MDARVAVAVRDVNLTLWRERSMRTAVERFTAHILGGLAGHADLEQHLAVERAFADKMPTVVSQIDRIVRPHMDAMRPRVLPFAPGTQEIAVAVEHHDRVLAPIEGKDIVLAVDADCSNLFERPALRQLRPILNDVILEVASADNLCHLRSP